MPEKNKPCKFICLTGGPGAGKTAVTKVIEGEFGPRVHIVPECASILYSNFPRPTNSESRKLIQRAIYNLQVFSEDLACHNFPHAEALICDRGTLDGASYWDAGREDFLKRMNTSLEAELARYSCVIHLETPQSENGYNFENPLRTESVAEAQELDEKLKKLWQEHPKRYFVRSRPSFVEKVDEVMNILRNELLNSKREKNR